MEDITFGLKLAFAMFYSVFSLILPIMLLFYIATHPIWWLWLFGWPGLFALITFEVYVCGYIWEEWIDD